MSNEYYNDLASIATESSRNEILEWLNLSVTKDYLRCLAHFLGNVRDALEFEATPETVLEHRGKAKALRMALDLPQHLLQSKEESFEGMPSEELTTKDEDDDRPVERDDF